MYSLKVESPDGGHPAITRRMSSNNASEILPIALEICKSAYHFTDLVCVNMGNNVWRMFDRNMSWFYAKVTITEDET